MAIEAVAGDVDGAVGGWSVEGVDVVPGARVGKERHVHDLVGEEGCFGYVLVVEEVGSVEVRVRGEVEGGEVGDGAVT